MSYVHDTEDPKLTKVPGFYQNQQQGWFWYQKDAHNEEEVFFDEENTFELIIHSPKSVRFSSQWFRENLQRYMDIAIDEPTENNIKTYLYLQKIMMDKSELFSNHMQQIVMQTPELDERNRRPFAPFASKALDKQARVNKENILGQLSQTTGIYFFYRSDCPYCHIQAPILKALNEKFGLTIMAIAIDGNPLPNELFPNFIKDTGQARALNVASVPTLFLMGKDRLYPLSQGVLSYEELIEQILLTAFTASLINSMQYESTKALKISGEEKQAVLDRDT